MEQNPGRQGLSFLTPEELEKLSGIILSGVSPIWIQPKVDQNLDILFPHHELWSGTFAEKCVDPAGQPGAVTVKLRPSEG